MIGQAVPAGPVTEPTGTGAVTVLSAHAAKGLEWDVVAVAGVQEGSWPDLRPRGSLLARRRTPRPRRRWAGPRARPRPTCSPTSDGCSTSRAPGRGVGSSSPRCRATTPRRRGSWTNSPARHSTIQTWPQHRRTGPPGPAPGRARRRPAPRGDEPGHRPRDGRIGGRPAGQVGSGRRARRASGPLVRAAGPCPPTAPAMPPGSTVSVSPSAVEALDDLRARARSSSGAVPGARRPTPRAWASWCTPPPRGSAAGCRGRRWTSPSRSISPPRTSSRSGNGTELRRFVTAMTEAVAGWIARQCRPTPAAGRRGTAGRAAARRRRGGQSGAAVRPGRLARGQGRTTGRRSSPTSRPAATQPTRAEVAENAQLGDLPAGRGARRVRRPPARAASRAAPNSCRCARAGPRCCGQPRSRRPAARIGQAAVRRAAARLAASGAPATENKHCERCRCPDELPAATRGPAGDPMTRRCDSRRLDSATLAAAFGCRRPPTSRRRSIEAPLDPGSGGGRSRIGQDRDDGGQGGLPGGERAGPARPDPRPDLHPQGGRPARRADPPPAADPGRVRGRSSRP